MKQTKFLNPPKECDVCHSQIGAEFYDAKTIYGPWANMCTDCFNSVGIGLGLGTGLGQYYKKDKEGNYIKQ